METANADAVFPKIRNDGHLANLWDWSPSVAEYLADQQGVELSAEHWEIINLMRVYYQTYNISPNKKLLVKEIREKLGEEKSQDAYLTRLFPGDVMKQGIIIAGVPIPLTDLEVRGIASKSQTPAATVGMANQIQEVQFAGRSIQLYAKGNLVNLDDWSPELAEFLAQKQGIQLSEQHWVVINFLRDFYAQYGIAPMVKLLIKHIQQKLGKEIGNKEYLYSLFPKGPARQGSCIAGLPEPQGCIDP